MQEPITIKIPLRPHLRNYITRKLRCNPDGKFRLKIDDPTDSIAFYIFLASVLMKKAVYLSTGQRHISVRLYGEIPEDSYIYIELGPWYAENAGFFLDEKTVYLINKYLDRHFRHELFIYLHSNIMYNPSFVVAYGIEDFFDIYNICDDHISKDAITRYWNRYKKHYSYVN
jgi:hypothetical protein